MFGCFGVVVVDGVVMGVEDYCVIRCWVVLGVVVVLCLVCFDECFW